MNDIVANKPATIEFGGQEFWKLYDELCSPDSLSRLVNEGSEYPPASQMLRITKAAHLTRAIHTLSRSERGWGHHCAWLALKHQMIQNYEGQFGMDMRAGDVVAVEFGWDRDVVITHSPSVSMVSGYLLSGKWEPMIGLFLPLFDKETILCAAKLRVAKNSEEAEKLAIKESEDWSWY
jgi:hypothetical protein